jgi:hypothetical protein
MRETRSNTSHPSNLSAMSSSLFQQKGEPHNFQSWRLGLEKSDLGNKRSGRRNARTQVGRTLPSGQDSLEGSLPTRDGQGQAIIEDMECRASQEILSPIFMYSKSYYLITCYMKSEFSLIHYCGEHLPLRNK